MIKQKNVLVGVLKSHNDLRILLKLRWYRIPVEYVPKRKSEYIAFYQPSLFGKKGKRIEYYARVWRMKRVKRINLLPKEISHPRAQKEYLKVEFKEIKKLASPIRNLIPRRISFGFTSFKKLNSAKNVLELYSVPPIEQLVEKALKYIGIKAIREYTVSQNGKRCRIDLVVFHRDKKIAIECDNEKSHKSREQLKIDKKKDYFLRRNGWQVVRLKERDIIERLEQCIKIIKKTMKK